MDGIAAIGVRIAAIQGALSSLAPTGPSWHAAPAAVATSGTPSGPASGTARATASDAVRPDFATVLEHARASADLPVVAGFTAEQTANAWAVAEAGRSRGLSLRDQALGVMTAIGESSLRVLDHGDAAGPDSRGLFQQRDNGAWGTLAQRMDPTASALSFFRALEQVGGRDATAPTLVAHAVQRNADPQHYARYWDDAVRLVASLRRVPPAQVSG